MKEKVEPSDKDISLSSGEFRLQVDRIKKILDDAIYKLEVLRYFPNMIEDDGKILREFLNDTEADFIMIVCQDVVFDRSKLEERSDLLLTTNMLEKTNASMKTKGSAIRSVRSIVNADSYEMHVACAVDMIFRCQPLIDYVLTLEPLPGDNLVKMFLDSMGKMRKIMEKRLSVSAVEEIARENDLKTAYRSSMMLSDNIQELEEQLERQRQELGKENDRKQDILDSLSSKIQELQEKTKTDIHKIIYDSELVMMKDYNRSVELQEELAEIAEETTRQYENLVEEHINKERSLRAKRLKIEAQLGSWVAKYDTDMGEKQEEYERLENDYNSEKEAYEQLQERFAEQDKEYSKLMAEKEAEEDRIREEMAWIFLQNRSARTIQRGWRAHKARKLARKKGKKGKKGSGGKKKGSGDKKKKPEEQLTLKGGPDPNAIIEGKFNQELLADIEQKDAFTNKDVTVDLVD